MSEQSFIDFFGEDPTDITKLDPELRRYIREKHGFTIIHHPLLVELGVLWKPANERFAWKKAELTKALVERDWRRVVWLYERPYRLETLRQLWRDKWFDLETLRDLLPSVWSDSEPKDTDRRWLTLWRQATKTGPLDLPPADADGTLRVFRGGVKPDEKLGIAWTTSIEVARFFALRTSSLGVVFTGRVHRDAVLAYVTERSESEIIVDPALVNVDEVFPVTQGEMRETAEERMLEMLEMLDRVVGD